MIRRSVTDVLRVYRREWWRIALSQLLTGLVLGVVLYGILLLSTAVAGALTETLTVDGSLAVGPALAFSLVLLLVFIVTALPVLVIGSAAVVSITNDVLEGHRPSIFVAFGGGVRRAPRLVLLLLLIVGMLLLLLIAAPLITAIGILGLVLSAVVYLIRRRKSAFLPGWPSLRAFSRWAIPFLLAGRWAATSLLAFPTAVVEETATLASIREANARAESHRGRIVLTVVLAWLLAVVIGAGLAALGYLLGGDLGGQIAQVLPPLLLVPATLVVMTVLYRHCADLPSATAAAAAVHGPRRERRTLALTASTVRRVATLMPAVLVLAGLAFAQAPLAAAAGPLTAITLTVTSDADDTDAGTLAAQQQNCSSGTGECTLRAALAEAATLSRSGTTQAITIDFASDVTILQAANSPLVFNNTGVGPGSEGPGPETPGGEGPPPEGPNPEGPGGETPPTGPGEGSTTGTLTIDGLGHAVTIDGQNATQILTLFSHAWDFVVRGLELRNGNATSFTVGQGGGLNIGGSRTALVEAMSFVDNVASAGGGLYLSSTATVRNSTFSGNSLGGPNANVVVGGADLFAGGRVSAINNTFAGSHNGAIYNWSSAGYTLSLDNSLIAISASDAQGGFTCSGGGITGSANVVAFSDTTCPGLVQNVGPFLGALVRTSAGTPPVHNLLPGVGNVAIGAAGAGPAAVACPPTDARGVARPSTGCDAGSYQFSPATALSLSTPENPAPYGDAVPVTARVVSPTEPTPIISGAVQFSVDGVDQGAPVALAYDGTAVLYLHPPAAGDYAISAVYTPPAGSSFLGSATISPLVQTVVQVGTDVWLRADSATVNLGEEAELTIDVGDAGRVVTGTVSLFDVTDGTEVPVLEAQPLDGTTLVLRTSALAAGARLLVAAYSGDANNAAGRSTRLALTVLSPSTVALQSDVASAAYGAPITFTATVPTSAGTVPTGSVAFTLGAGGPLLGEVALVNGSAALSLDRLSTGSRTVVARYLGGGLYSPSDATSAQVTVAAASTTVSISGPAAEPFAYGAPVTLTAVVRTTAADSTADPVGDVTFSDSGFTLGASVILGTAVLIGNGDGTSTASYTTSAGQLPVGAPRVSAQFVGGDDFAPSLSAEATFAVVAAPTTLTLTSDGSPAPFGHRLQLTATVQPGGGSLAVPSGTVTFTANGITRLGTAVLSGGVATIEVSGFALGLHGIRAVYAASGSFGGSSGDLSQQVSAAATTTAVTVERPTSVYGQSVRVDIAVAAQGGDAPDGTVVLSEGETTHAILTVTDGVASVSLSTLGAATHDLTATFQASDGYLSSTGSVQLAVTAASTSVEFEHSPTESVIGNPVTLSATVRTTDSLSGAAPHGSVRFLFNGSLLGAVPLTPAAGASSTASLSTSALPQSSQYPGTVLPLSVEFVPDATAPDFTVSEAAGSIRVKQGTTAIALSVTPGAVGAEVTATATISVTSGSGVPTGTVRFFYGETITDVAVVDGRAVLAGLRFPRGSNHITALYTSGDFNFLAGVPDGSDRIGVTVETGAAAPTVELSSSVTGSTVYGTEATLTARISGDGPAPTGLVTFSSRGPNGTVELGTAALVTVLGPTGVATATLSSSAIPVGAQEIVAVYSGDFSYAAAESAELEQTVTSAPTTTTVTASSDPSSVGVAVTYTATVRTTTGAIPSGTVTFTADGVPLGTSTVNSAGVATATSVPSLSGTVAIVAVFAPATANVLASTGELAHAVSKLPTQLRLSVDRTNVGVGEPAILVVSVTPLGAYETVTSELPGGDVTITASNGSQCTTTLTMRGPGAGEMLGECSIAFATAGTRSLSAVYSGDTIFAGGTTNVLSVTSARLASTIDFVSSAERAWVGGETTRLFWDVRGPSADDAAVTISSGSIAVCTSTQRTGSCDYTFPFGFTGSATFTLQYAGSAAWLSGNATLSQPVTACIATNAPNVSPAGSGAVIAEPVPNCAGGTGYLAGTVVRYTATPNVGYDFDRWQRGTDTVVADVGSPVTNMAFFTARCVPVTLAVIDKSKPGGRISSSQEPNCGALPREWNDTPAGKVGLFLPGTSLSLTATLPPETRPGPLRFYQWTGLDAEADPLAAATTFTVEAEQSRRVVAVFGVLCYHNVTFPTPVGGTAELGPTNCADPAGPGYAADSTVSVSTKSTGNSFFSGWSDVMINDVVSTTTGSSGKLYISGDNLRVRAIHSGCVQVRLAVAGELPNGTRLGSATIEPLGNCPSLGDGWYKTGSNVFIKATPTMTNAFGGWSGLSGIARPTQNSTSATITEGGTLTATFYSRMRCVPFTLVSVPAGAMTLTATFAHGTGTCPAGQYDTSLGTGPANSNEVTVTATPVTPQAQSAIIGWNGTTKRLDANSISQPFPIAGLESSTFSANIYGDTTLVAWACQRLDAQLTLISPNGTPHTTGVPANTDFVNVAPTTNCGFGRSTYTLGSRVFLLADGSSPGYSFVGWSGAITSTDPYPTTPIALDGGSRSVKVGATYQVTCYTLATNYDNVAVDPAPNCPDTPASAHAYIGGTAVTIMATGDGDLVFRGWSGDPEVADGAIAVTMMADDMAVYADYTSKSVGERITDVANSVGDAIAITSKKIVGVAAAVVGGIVMGANPLTAAMGLVVLLGKAVQGVAGLLGVDSAGLRAFGGVISNISELMTFFGAATQCATVWSASAGGGPPSTAGASSTQAVGTVLAKQLLAEQKAAEYAAARALQQQAIATSFQSQTSATLGQAKVWAGRLGAVASAGMGVYSMVSSGSGVAWDESADSAWTTGGDTYSTCYAQALPSFFGLPPLPPQYTQGQ